MIDRGRAQDRQVVVGQVAPSRELDIRQNPALWAVGGGSAGTPGVWLTLPGRHLAKKCRHSRAGQLCKPWELKQFAITGDSRFLPVVLDIHQGNLAKHQKLDVSEFAALCEEHY